MRTSRSRRVGLAVAAVAFCLGAAACTPTGEPTTQPGPSASVLSDEEAAQAFFDAVVAGDRDAAAAVADPSALAFFEPWEPVEGLTFSGVQDGIFFINPGAAPFQCTVIGGVVGNCSDEPTGEGPTDEEAAQAFFDAVVAGDRDAAHAVASAEAVAFFEPWEPVEGLTFSGVQDGIFFINPGAAPFQCSVFSGVVEGCLDEPTGE